ncbi:exopolyphosphatase PRUNE1, partial [Leptidea sinapis]|uniref:exopolyphosphatase PRUNE1 n=1 Tax=Leptidea sinapis TaxID=189913 RepID=UPI0021C2ECEA
SLQKSKNFDNLTLVIGNESCDLDSAVSSLVYATFLHWQHQIMKCKVCTRNKRDNATYKDDLFLPVLDVPRNDYNLKTEVVFSFKEFGISESNLLFMNRKFERLIASRSDISSLTPDQILRKDLKIIGNIMVPAFPILVQVGYDGRSKKNLKK